MRNQRDTAEHEYFCEPRSDHSNYHLCGQHVLRNFSVSYEYGRYFYKPDDLLYERGKLRGTYQYRQFCRQGCAGEAAHAALLHAAGPGRLAERAVRYTW